jgi:hypothetical protein
MCVGNLEIESEGGKLSQEDEIASKGKLFFRMRKQVLSARQFCCRAMSEEFSVRLEAGN